MIFTKRDRELLEDLIEENRELRKTINVMRGELTRFKVDLKHALDLKLKAGPYGIEPPDKFDGD